MDNNFWINCNRAGHGHGPSDGNMAHVQALYGILGELRRRYPDLLIENVSGGGARIDFGMLAYTDAAWMTYRTDLLDDETASLLALQIAEYKTYRDIITQSNATLLTEQAPVDWDIELIHNGGSRAHILVLTAR